MSIKQKRNTTKMTQILSDKKTEINIRDSVGRIGATKNWRDSTKVAINNHHHTRPYNCLLSGKWRHFGRYNEDMDISRYRGKSDHKDNAPFNVRQYKHYFLQKNPKTFRRALKMSIKTGKSIVVEKDRGILIESDAFIHPQHILMEGLM